MPRHRQGFHSISLKSSPMSLPVPDETLTSVAAGPTMPTQGRTPGETQAQPPTLLTWTTRCAATSQGQVTKQSWLHAVGSHEHKPEAAHGARRHSCTLPSSRSYMDPMAVTAAASTRKLSIRSALYWCLQGGSVMIALQAGQHLRRLPLQAIHSTPAGRMLSLSMGGCSRRSGWPRECLSSGAS